MSRRKEWWEPIAGFEGFYEVSNYGRIRSLTRWVAINGGWKLLLGRIMKLTKPRFYKGKRHHYTRIELRKEGHGHYRLVHLVVLTAFHGTRPQGKFGLHKDDDRKNNQAWNLYWGTAADNYRDCLRNRPEVAAVRRRSRMLRMGKNPDVVLEPVKVKTSGLEGNYREGANTPMSKLTEAQALRIIELAKSGIIPAHINKLFPHVTIWPIIRICKGTGWKHLPR